ncbi:AfsR/SARP family transcriptional regulator [Streptomyces canus]|uniref:AfsR/SARP family transcriptional regulator n=1 Tax=Streptomyces canus TaxID=58343 RepID=UPI00225713D1|nr:AfsR/SARP family transcriptional regulator [Streptomyces canus]MCX4856326.1 AfsR/SARP family transcriptional regulator [Streptomyces canus]WSW38206.1 AfsR/SARP family transcriptional regulator [Streptomyces canus]
MTDISVLGSLTVTHTGRSIVPTAAKPRKVLALLALRPDQAVSVSAFLEELWEQRPPRSALTTLQTYILRLRNLIEAAEHGRPSPGAASRPHSREVLATWGSGYLLSTHGGRIDIHDFEQLAAAGHRAMAATDYRTASDSFRRALALWRDEALVDVQAGPLLSTAIRHLEEQRLSLLSRQVEADLRLGRHHELLSDLASLCAQYPLHEGFQAQYMLALCRAGRRSDALQTFQRLRRRIREELAMDPSPALHRLQQAVLNGDAGLDLPEQPLSESALRLAG